jgi:D-serine deaminase-like pyridoxal phosphate-dependent protein
MSTFAGQLAASELPAGKRGYSLEELDAKISREGKPENLFKVDLPTPALILDLDAFERNVKKMADYAASRGKQLRPHAKTHKCVAIAQRQLAAGAVGICVATVPEATVLAAGGIEGLLLTSPIGTPQKAARMAKLAVTSPGLMAAIDHPKQVEWYEAAAAEAGTTLNVLVDLNVSDRRTGVLPGEPAVELAQAVMKAKHLKLRGLQAYSGGSSHVVGFAARREQSRRVMGQAIETRELFQRRGLPDEILSGTSTGTHNIDAELAGTTEMQVGSYIVMDVDYLRIGGESGPVFDTFTPALAVLATVVSVNSPKRVSLDAGFKALATDRPFGPDVKDITGVKYGFGGDEFGIISWEDAPSRLLELGDRLELIVPHCDPTVNLYDRIYACRGDRVEEIWSVMGRLRHG